MTGQRKSIRRELLRRRDQLIPRWRALIEEENRLLDHKSPDWEDMAAEQRDAALLDRLGETELACWRQIEAALDRLDRGSYGTCSQCGNHIDDRRLRAMPEATTCRPCAAETEAETARIAGA